MASVGLSADERELLDLLGVKGCIRAADVVRVRGVGPAAANQILSRLARKGWLWRVRRGSYLPVRLGRPIDDYIVEDLWPVVAERFAPCYVSGASAAYHWGSIDDAPLRVFVVTARAQRRARQFLDGVDVRVRVVDEKALFGTDRIEIDGHVVSVADRHRWVIDALDRHGAFGSGWSMLRAVRRYMEGDRADPDRLLDYAARLGRSTVFKRLGYLAQRFDAAVDPAWLDRCCRGVTAGVRLLDGGGRLKAASTVAGTCA